METAAIVAVKLALVAPEATVTDDGTVTDALLLVRLTAWPPLGAAAVSVAVQLSVPAPVIDPLVQLSSLSCCCGALVAPRLMLVVNDAPPDDAVSVAVCAVETAAIVAVKLALVSPEATVTDDGTVTDALLLVRLTAWPPLGATAVSVAVQLSVPAPVIDPLVQLRDCAETVPVPLELVVVGLLERLLESLAPPHASRFTERKETRRARKAALCLSRLGAARLSFGETIGFSAFLREWACSKRGKVGSITRACFMY